jgi:hypothetical protein
VGSSLDRDGSSQIARGHNVQVYGQRPGEVMLRNIVIQDRPGETALERKKAESMEPYWILTFRNEHIALDDVEWLVTARPT